MKPAVGERLRRFVGDRVNFTAGDSAGRRPPKGWSARLRTNLGRGGILCKEIVQAHAKKLPLAGASWHDLPMQPTESGWELALPLTEPGHFTAKAYLIDPQGWQHWPDGADVGISVHPDNYRTGNTIYCAFTRMFGATRTLAKTVDEKQEAQFKQWDARGYTVIPPSGTFRDLIQQLPHIIDTLGCRILHLLPVSPVPTTGPRFGRFGSPYASLDLAAVDPALVVFDQLTTGIDQFRELTSAAHQKNARVFLDIVINHTGWGSNLQENHPEWFLRGPDGKFASPGAWGTTWEDLVELEHKHVALWDYLAEVFLIWLRRGVDGFRCDAGYKVPLAAWQYITARVRQEFPEAIFLLEGLGGPWAVTEQLLTEGGMQWAYSELFQNYTGRQVADYLDYSLRQSEQTGLLVHYSETHDNERLAARGRKWSLMRNRLCALASVSGGYGFTCGVEWLAPERVNVHSSRGLAWGNPDNLVPELAALNRLITDHPCFFEHAKLTRLSEPDSPLLALWRDSEEGVDSVLVLANLDIAVVQSISFKSADANKWGKLEFELTGQKPPKLVQSKEGGLSCTLEPGAVYCLSASAQPRGLAGDAYRLARARAAWGTAALGRAMAIEEIPAMDWRDVAAAVDKDPAAFLAACADTDLARENLKRLTQANVSAGEEQPGYARVIKWTRLDVRRILPVPPGHWLLLEDAAPFRATLCLGGSLQHVQSIQVAAGHVACFAPCEGRGDARLTVESYAADHQQIEAQVRFLAESPDMSWLPAIKSPPRGRDLALLTNGIGGMARLCLDFGAITSKYDCLLGANLHPRVPVDRHILAKRARVWINADGFITPLDARNLISFEPGPPARWHFRASAGDGRTVDIAISAEMIPGCNTTLLHFSRPKVKTKGGKAPPEKFEARLTVRVDIEDRNFHGETKRNGGAEYHFASNTRALDGSVGFVFAPAADRQLRVIAGSGFYHPQEEWCENIPHPVEESRGQVGGGDAYSPGWFDLPMAAGAEVSLTVTAELEGATARPVPQAQASAPFDDEFGRQLMRAAQDFVARRDDGVTVIAGYPWFLDWGRDSLICARGLLAAGMVEEVKQLLVTFGRFEKDGTLPNTIHGDDASNRDTSDAALWYGIVCEEMAEHSGHDLYQLPVDKNGRTVESVLVDIAANYAGGTPNGIRLDPYSGLIWSPSHFTWMDTNHPAGTPREGYPVEIQVLWIRLLRQLSGCTGVGEGRRWGELADQAQASLEKFFWIADRGYFADLLMAKAGQPAAEATVDNALRSNCLLAVSLGLVKGERAQRCVDAAARYLVVPGALRTLAPLPVSPPLPIYGNQGQLLNNPPEPYWGRYEGDEDTRRKPAYHNGTAWTWTFPNFCEALARAWEWSPGAVTAARAYLGSMDRVMREGCVGQIPEIADGDAPHQQRGCDAQAWGVTEALRVWKLLQDRNPTKKPM
jgi:starch synthase (maltosyl-transferring)